MAGRIGKAGLERLRMCTVGVVSGALHFLLVSVVYSRVPEPYMDEIFHLNQTRKYCIGDYSWNEKITTPPGTYILAMSAFCGHERFLNSVLWPIGIVAAIRFRRLFTQSTLTSTAVVVMSLPVLMQSSLLFYTDLCSLITVLWALSLNNELASAFFFSFSVLTRQTNIVWAAAYGVYHLFRRVDPHCPRSVYVSIVSSFVRLSPLVFLGAAFLIFFVLNDYSIVLGDHSAHHPAAHFMQLYYLLVFICFSAAPYMLLSGNIFGAMRNILRRPLRSLLWCMCITMCVFAFTMDHPYLLADNRHFTFYIWRWWFRRHWICKYILVPVYLVAAEAIAYSISHIARFVVIIYVVATAAVLVPARLLEPRYFIIPFVLWRLSVREERFGIVLLELIYHACINSLVLHLFLHKPFEWVTEPGAKQRFMW